MNAGVNHEVAGGHLPAKSSPKERQNEGGGGREERKGEERGERKEAGQEQRTSSSFQTHAGGLPGGVNGPTSGATQHMQTGAHIAKTA